MLMPGATFASNVPRISRAVQIAIVLVIVLETEIAPGIDVGSAGNPHAYFGILVTLEFLSRLVLVNVLN